jgi:hypothetical protein
MAILYTLDGFTGDIFGKPSETEAENPSGLRDYAEASLQGAEIASTAFAYGPSTCHEACRMHTLSCTSTVSHAAVSSRPELFGKEIMRFCHVVKFLVAQYRQGCAQYDDVCIKRA